MRSTTGRPGGRFVALALTASFLVIAFPTSALAQIDVSETVDGVGDKVDETVDATTDAADRAVGSVEQTVDQTAGPEGGTVDQTTDVVRETTGQAGQTLDATTDETTDTAADATRARISVDGPLGETAGQVGAVVDSILGGPRDGRPRTRQGADNDGGTAPRSISATQSVTDGFAASASSATSATAVGSAADAGLGTLVSSKSPIERLIQSVGDVLPQVAFPLALLILVGAFLAIQNRVDRSDPKLALAPIDIDQEYLSFR